MSFDPILKAAVEHHVPAGLIYVGSSDSDTTQLWPFTDWENPIWISSSSDLQEKIKQQPQKFENIIPYFECVSKQAGTIDFYDASLSEFSGNINPTVLKPYWQNIKTVKTTKRTVTTLDKLCSQNSEAHKAWASANWLIIDQLAALDILKGGQAFLPQLDGMIIKVFLPDGSPCTPELATSSKEQISEWLKQHNFTAVVQKEGRHKSFTHILFIRNWKVEYESLNDKLKEQLSEMGGKVQALQVQKDDAQIEYKKQLNMVQIDLEVKLQSSDKLTEDIKKQQKETLGLKSKIESKLARIAVLSNETKDLKSQLISAQDINLRKEKQAELHLQDLEFLREKFKGLKQEYDDNIELLKNVQSKLLAVVNDKSIQPPGGDVTQEPN